jgi:hypothetical protein
MTVAIRLRCTCRRTLATLNHGADQFELTERERNNAHGLDSTNPDLAITTLIGSSFPVTSLNDVSIRCDRCRDRRRFSATQLEEAMRRSQQTGKPVDIIANDP